MDPDQIRRILLQQSRQWQAAGVQYVAKQAATDFPVGEVAMPLAPMPTPPQRPPSSPPIAQEIPESQGLREMPKAKKQPAAAPPPVAVSRTVSSANEPWPADLAQLSTEDRQARLDQLRQQVAGCTLCAELARTRTQTVFGVGNPMARIAFFGEAPGADEDRQGEPFVGRAGKLLTQIIEACTFERGDVYILNTLKCRPPGNRNPTVEENDNCRPYFERQLEIIQPKYIVCLGRFAINNLLDSAAPIGKLRGQFHPYRGSKVVVTYHPAYLLRNPSAKKDVWDDMKMMLSDMGIAIPKPTK